ncbi:MAG: 30S ribosomal protein S16 [Kiritimatiellia bacterium]|jgi:small subunit ribosomal protein S16
MAVKVRLTRTGANRDNCFRIVASDARFPRDGRFIEQLGWYDPKKAGKNFGMNVERIEYWVSTGAQLSETVRSLLRREKLAAKAAE